MKDLEHRPFCNPKDFCRNVPKAGRFWTGSEYPPNALRNDKKWTQRLARLGTDASAYTLELLDAISLNHSKNEQLRKALSAGTVKLDAGDPDTPFDIQILKNIFISGPYD